MPSDCSMAGISRLHIDAATITPAAKPARARCTEITKGFFHKEHAGRAQRCTQERDHDSKKGFHLSHRLCIAFIICFS